MREPLKPHQPNGLAKEMPQGHYRIGARDLPAAYDNELPPQAVELSSFRIGVNPVMLKQAVDEHHAKGIYVYPYTRQIRGCPAHRA